MSRDRWTPSITDLAMLSRSERWRDLTTSPPRFFAVSHPVLLWTEHKCTPRTTSSHGGGTSTSTRSQAAATIASKVRVAFGVTNRDFHARGLPFGTGFPGIQIRQSCTTDKPSRSYFAVQVPYKAKDKAPSSRGQAGPMTGW